MESLSPTCLPGTQMTTGVGRPAPPRLRASSLQQEDAAE